MTNHVAQSCPSCRRRLRLRREFGIIVWPTHTAGVGEPDVCPASGRPVREYREGYRQGTQAALPPDDP